MSVRHRKSDGDLPAMVAAVSGAADQSVRTRGRGMLDQPDSSGDLLAGLSMPKPNNVARKKPQSARSNQPAKKTLVGDVDRARPVSGTHAAPSRHPHVQSLNMAPHKMSRETSANDMAAAAVPLPRYRSASPAQQRSPVPSPRATHTAAAAAASIKPRSPIPSPRGGHTAVAQTGSSTKSGSTPPAVSRAGSNMTLTTSRATSHSRLDRATSNTLLSRGSSAAHMPVDPVQRTGSSAWRAATARNSLDISAHSAHGGRDVRPVTDAEALAVRARSYDAGVSVEAIRSFAGTSFSLNKGPTLVCQHIVLGARDDATNAELMHKMGVTHVLNMASQLPNYHEKAGTYKFVYLKIPLLDDEATDVRAAMKQAFPFMERVENLRGRVMVHCIAGASRSVTVVLMYLMMKHSIPLRTAYNYVKSHRPQVAVNDGFKMQLALLEVELFGCTSVGTKKAGPDWAFYKWRSTAHQYQQWKEPEDGCCAQS